MVRENQTVLEPPGQSKSELSTNFPAATGRASVEVEMGRTPELRGCESFRLPSLLNLRHEGRVDGDVPATHVVVNEIHHEELRS